MTSYFYNSVGDLTKTVDPAGKATEYTFDQLGRQTARREISTDFPAGVSWTQTLDPLGRATVQTEPPATNAVTATIRTRRMTTVFDPNGNVTSTVESDVGGADPARTTSFTYDLADRERSRTSASGVTWKEYDAVGNVSATIYALGRRYEFTYNSRN